MDPQVLREAMTAYQAVYDEDLRETIEFENWVNALLDEGYDLSDYTWEDMYEAYIGEGLIGDVWANRGKIGSAVKGAVSGANRAATAANKGIGSSFRNTASAVKGAVTSAPARAAASGFGSGGLLGAVSGAVQSSRQQKPATTATKPATTPATTPATKPATTPATKPATTATKPATTPATKPATTTATRPATTTATRPAATTATRPAATTATKPATTATKPATTSTTAAAPKRTFNPLMQKTFGYQTGYAPSQVKGDVKKMAQTGSLKSISSGFDMFDVVKGHLLDEGYADTEEAALAIMANMSEEWRDSIISEAPGEWFGGLRDKARASRAAQMQSLKPTPKPGPTVSSPFAKPASRNDSGRLTTYGAGGGAEAERRGQTRAQVMQQGAKNLERKNTNPGPNFGR